MKHNTRLGGQLSKVGVGSMNNSGHKAEPSGTEQMTWITLEEIPWRTTQYMFCLTSVTRTMLGIYLEVQNGTAVEIWELRAESSCQIHQAQSSFNHCAVLKLNLCAFVTHVFVANYCIAEMSYVTQVRRYWCYW